MKVTLPQSLLRFLTIFAMLATLLVGGQALNLATSPAAQAAGGCSSVAACLSTEVSNSVSGSGGTGLGGGGNIKINGNTATVSAPPTPATCADSDSGVKSCAALYNIRSKFVPANGPTTGGCAYATKTVNGFTIKAVGEIQTDRQDFIEWSKDSTGAKPLYPIYTNWYNISANCIFGPDPTVTQTSLTCILGWDGQITRLPQSKLGGPATVANGGGQVSTVDSLKENPDSCQTSFTAGLAYNPPGGQDGYGQYQSGSTIQQVTCDIGSTTFEGQTTKVIRCGNPYSVPGGTGYLTVWCDGYSNQLLTKSWNAQDCINGSNYRVGCSIPGQASYNGFYGNVQGVRDGDPRILQWSDPVAVGALSTNNWRSNTWVKDGTNQEPPSTPWNKNVGVNDKDKQLFFSDQAFDSYISGKNLTQQLGFYQASETGAPFSLQRTYMYDGTFVTNYTSIRSIDLRTGAISVANSSQTSTFVGEVCPVQTSNKISVIRSIGDLTS